MPEHKAEPEAHPEVACLFLHLAEIERLSGDGTYEEISALVDKTVVAYSKAGYLGKNHPRTLSAKAEKCFLRHQMAPTVAYRHSGYLKMRMILETLMEKGKCNVPFHLCNSLALNRFLLISFQAFVTIIRG